MLHRAFNATLNANGDCYYQMSMNGISHHFIIVRLEGRYDFFESDDNPPAGSKLNLLLPGQGGRDLSRAYMTPQILAEQLAAMYERCGIGLPVAYSSVELLHELRGRAVFDGPQGSEHAARAGLLRLVRIRAARALLRTDFDRR